MTTGHFTETHKNLCRELYGMEPRGCPMPAEHGGHSGRFALKDQHGAELKRFDSRASARAFGIWRFVNHAEPNFIEDTEP